MNNWERHMSVKSPLTVEGYQQLKDELHLLKTKDRPEVIQAISQARAHGDLKENAEYAAAKEKQGYIEGKIQQLEALLSSAQIIDVSKLPHQGRVVFGSTISLLNTETDEEVQYKIVGEYEADIKQKKLSVAAPLTRAMIGKQEGDTFSFKTPAMNVEYEILKVEYI